MPAVLAALFGILIGAGGTAVAMHKLPFAMKPPPPHAQPCPSVCPSGAPAASGSAAPGASGSAGATDAPTGKATSLDAAAVKAIESMPADQRTAEHVVALTRAQSVEKIKAIRELVHKIELVPKVLELKENMKTLRQWANDTEVADDLMLEIAALPGPTGPDLLYTLGPAVSKKSEPATLAEQVLYSKDVRAKASPGLSILLELRREESCERVLKLLDTVKAQGDRRSFGLLAQLNNKNGCGPKKGDDCWPCLRNGDIIKDVVREITKRGSP